MKKVRTFTNSMNTQDRELAASSIEKINTAFNIAKSMPFDASIVFYEVGFDDKLSKFNVGRNACKIDEINIVLGVHNVYDPESSDPYQ